MNKKKFFSFFLLITLYQLNAHNTKLEDLLHCNLSHKNISSLCNAQRELNLYEAALRTEMNYPGSPIAPEAIGQNLYPNLHPTHQAVIDAINQVKINSICEVGACFGEVSKYIYNQNPTFKITCVEHNRTHFNQMKEHFESKPWLLKPGIKVNAKLIKDSLPHLSSIKNDSFDLVFTCAVMMHIPFIPAVKSAMEIMRISKKYILHVENKNEGSDWYNMAIMLPSTMSKVNMVGIDYRRLYESLGVKTLVYKEYKHPDCPGTFVVYLGEKIIN